jgi:hypothetical protein
MDCSVAILGCAKDCAKYLPAAIANMRAVGSMFRDYRLMIYENDSKDRTPEILHEAEKDAKTLLYGKRFLSAQLPHRTHAIAYARQALLNYLAEGGFRPDYVLVVDMDDIASSGAPQKGRNFVLQALELKDHWDAIFPKLTYDCFAFRGPGAIFNYLELPWTVGQAHSNKAVADYFKNLDDYKRADHISYDANGLMTVFSAFGGMAMYRYETYIRGRYSGKNQLFRPPPHLRLRTNMTSYDMQECEHVNFHYSLGPRTRLRMCRDINY